MDEHDKLRMQGQIEFGVNCQKRIDRVQDCLSSSVDAARAFYNLVTYLDDDIKNPIIPKLMEIQKKYKIYEDDFLRNPQYPETTFAWDAKHKRNYISAVLKNIHNESIQYMLQIVMQRLHEKNVLKNRDQESVTL